MTGIFPPNTPTAGNPEGSRWPDATGGQDMTKQSCVALVTHTGGCCRPAAQGSGCKSLKKIVVQKERNLKYKRVRHTPPATVGPK